MTATYNQLYKDQVIVTVGSGTGVFDTSLSDNRVFMAVGKQTKQSLTNYGRVDSFTLWPVKQDTVLNFEAGGTIKIFDDFRTLFTMPTTSLLYKHVTHYICNLSNDIFFSGDDTNISVGKFIDGDSMVTDIATIAVSERVNDFTATVTVPYDVKCNYDTGNHKHVYTQPLNLLFDGSIKKGDTITVKRNNRNDLTTTMNYDTDLAFGDFNLDGTNSVEIIYKHLNPVTPPDSQATPPDSQATPPDSQATPPATHKKFDIFPTLQNARITTPVPVIDDNSTTHYYIDSEHATITLTATTGYTFESDGAITYQKTASAIATLVIPATHTDTVTFSLPTDIDWSIQGVFNLTMGAVKPNVVGNAGAFTNIYKADYTNMLKFSNEIILKINGGYNGSIKAVDVKPYINNLIMIPFNVPTGDPTPIVAGNQTFDTTLPTVDNDYITVDLGKIKVDEQYKNGYDYYQVKARLMLPYTNMVDLNPIHVINKTVSIKYIVNVVNGDTTINLYNGTDLFYSEQVNLANQIPFISSVTKDSQYVVINQLKTMFRNDIQQPYIIIEQPNPILNSDYYSTDEKGTLQGYTGNVRASLLNNIDINVSELNALQNLLETGVKIK